MTTFIFGFACGVFALTIYYKYLVTKKQKEKRLDELKKKEK